MSNTFPATAPAPAAAATNTSASIPGFRTAAAPSPRRHRGRGLLALLPALGLVGITLAGAGPAHAAELRCDADCVGQVYVNRTLDSAYFGFSTTTPAKGSLTLGHLGGSHVKTYTESSATTNHHYATGRILKPGYRYAYTIKETDAWGNSRSETGSFKAPEQTVTITIDKVHITDDSDYGAGEISAYARSASKQITLWGEKSISAVKTEYVGKSIVLKNVGSSSKVEVALMDNDVDPHELGSCGTAPSYTVVENSCGDANAASKVVALSTALGTTKTTFSMSAPNHRLDFGVDATLTVTIA